ncbi:MAG: choice-of-anchor L domain-containing protein, partial [Bacteroidota bacterium]|nr:choice-of-anchor L domain-containing protein [Bacteroidota bacterium]
MGSMGWHFNLSLSAVILLPCFSSAQLVIDTSATAEQLVETLVGPGVTISNVTQPINFFEPGHPWRGSATFTGGTGTNLGMPAGIILGSGPVMYAAPWSPTPLSTQYIWTYGDDDLTVLAGGTPGSLYAITKDASVLEFDLVPNGDSIKFRFIFASDEYPEWVCSQYNDVFGFFLSGPGINGTFSNNSVNLAVIPGTNVPIAVNSINSGEVGGITFPYPESTCAETDPNWQDNSIYYVDNEFGPDIYYDGFTVVMEAKSAVQCGETYHIKLAIADYVDAFYDSAVFLEAGSFSSTGEPGGVSLVPGIGISGDTLTAGCLTEFLIERNGDISTAAMIDLIIGGTATSGVDYEPAFPMQLTFGPGEASQTLLVDVPIDGDALETIVIMLTGLMTCAGAAEAEYTFYINPSTPLEVELADAALGCVDEQVLEPVVTGGTGSYEYLWSTGETTPTITVQTATDTEYEVTVNDGCSVQPVTVSAMVTVDATPIEITVSPDLDVPCGEESEIEVIQISGGTAPFAYEWMADGAIAGNTQSISVMGG